MLQQLLSTRPEWTGLILRLTLGGVMAAHGAQKLLGWFGGYGFGGTMQFFTETVHLPWVLGAFIILLESIGALLLLVGALTRLWAALFIPLLIGIIATTHWPNGFFMNWFGQFKGEGYEYFVLALGLAFGLLFSGGGRWSVDRLVMRASRAPAHPAAPGT